MARDSSRQSRYFEHILSAQRYDLTSSSRTFAQPPLRKDNHSVMDEDGDVSLEEVSKRLLDWLEATKPRRSSRIQKLRPVSYTTTKSQKKNTVLNQARRDFAVQMSDVKSSISTAPKSVQVRFLWIIHSQAFDI